MPRIAAVSLVLAAFVPFVSAQQNSEAEAPAKEMRAKEMRWWKGNLHTHSLWSDGNDFPEVIAKMYRDHGYHFLGLSDHNILSNVEKWMKVDLVVRRGGRRALQRYRQQFGRDWVETRDGKDGKLEVRLKRLDEFRPRVEETGTFLMIQAEEITDKWQKAPIHMNATNIGELIKPQGGTSVRRVMARNLAAVKAQSSRLRKPIVLHLNHPNFGWAVSAEDLAAVLEERFFEVYNGHPGVNHLGDDRRPGVERQWDIACTLRIDRYQAPPPFGLATDDSHHYFTEASHMSNSGRGWVMVHAEKLEPDAITTAIDRGDFYSSSGVTLREVAVRDGVLSLEVEGVEGESYTTQFIGTMAGYDRTATPPREKGGRPARGTWTYSKDVGKVLSVVKGRSASYRLTGKELYVRAVVTSTGTPANPSFEGQKKQAWTQPVGWEKRVTPVHVPLDPLRGPRGPRLGPSGPGVVKRRGDQAVVIGLRGLDVQGQFRTFWSMGDELLCTGDHGDVEALIRVPKGHRDLCVFGDRVYVAVNMGPTVGQGGSDSYVYVYDADTLEFVARHALPDVVHGAAGIACAGGHFFVTSERVPGQDVNLVYRYDGAFALQHTLEIPGAMPQGIQTATYAENMLWLGCAGETQQLLVIDVDGNELFRGPFECASGIAALSRGRFLAADGLPDRAAVAEPDGKGGLRLVRR